MNINKREGLIVVTNLLLMLIIVLSGIACKTQDNSNEKQKEHSPKLDSQIGNDLLSIDTINNYKDGKKEGLWKELHQNGQLKSEGNYKAGKKEGLHKEWKPNGKLALEGFYRNGKAHGLMKWYHDKGHLAAEGHMVEDKRDGKWTICDINELTVCIEAHFEEDQRTGIWKIFHDNGQLWKEQTWKADQVLSEKCWDETGKKIACN